LPNAHSSGLNSAGFVLASWGWALRLREKQSVSASRPRAYPGTEARINHVSVDQKCLTDDFKQRWRHHDKYTARYSKTSADRAKEANRTKCFARQELVNRLEPVHGIVGRSEPA